MYRKNNNPFLLWVPHGFRDFSRMVIDRGSFDVKQLRNSVIFGKFDSVSAKGAVRL
jgi:hypothetical protein